MYKIIVILLLIIILLLLFIIYKCSFKKKNKKIEDTLETIETIGDTNEALDIALDLI